MKQTNALGVIRVFRRIFGIFGLPVEVISDNGAPFTSKKTFKIL